MFDKFRVREYASQIIRIYEYVDTQLKSEGRGETGGKSNRSAELQELRHRIVFGCRARTENERAGPSCAWQGLSALRDGAARPTSSQDRGLRGPTCPLSKHSNLSVHILSFVSISYLSSWSHSIAVRKNESLNPSEV